MLRRCYQAEVIKNRHTVSGRLSILMPLIVVGLSLGFAKEYVVIDSHNWWYMGLLPAMVGIICGMSGEREQRLKYRGVLSLPISMKNIWDGKVLYGIRALTLSVLILVVTSAAVNTVLSGVFKLAFPIEISVMQQLAAGIVLFAVSLWQVPWCLILQQLFGNAAGLLFHVVSYGILSCTLSLYPCFMVLPGGVAARLMCIILKILPNGLPARPGSMTFSPELLDSSGIPAGILSTILWFFLLWLVGRCLFERKVQS